MFFGRFAGLCKDNGTSPSAVIKQLGLSSSTANTWKSGGKPSADALQKLADYFNVSTDYLLGRTDYPTGLSSVTLSPATAQLLEMLEGLTAEQQKAVIELIQSFRAP